MTDGGLETELIFHDGLDLPAFAAFPLLENPQSRGRLRRYYDGYLAVARKHRAGFVVETPTWRANPDWARQLGYSPDRLDAVNRAAVDLAEEVRAAAPGDGLTAVISGCIGPRGDGYDPGDRDDSRRGRATTTPSRSARSRRPSADQVTAITMTNTAEAIGVVRAASAAGIPSAISFTVETDGSLPTGQPLHEAIAQVDAETDGAAAYFMINCAHPTHFSGAFARDGAWRERLVGSARERVDQEPRRTRRGDRARRGRSGRARCATRRTAGPAASRHRVGRLLWHRRPARRRDRRSRGAPIKLQCSMQRIGCSSTTGRSRPPRLRWSGPPACWPPTATSVTGSPWRR